MVSLWVLEEFHVLYCAHDTWCLLLRQCFGLVKIGLLLKGFFCIYPLLYISDGCLWASILKINKICFYLSEREKWIKIQKRYISWNTISSYIFEKRVFLTFIGKLKGKTLGLLGCKSKLYSWDYRNSDAILWTPWKPYSLIDQDLVSYWTL